MKGDSRTKKTMLNIRINLICYLVSLVVSFFTRKVFLDCLGKEFMGYTTTVSSLLSFLNLADLGIGTAIAFLLYKPLFDGDKNKINELISVFGYLYHIVGFVILGAGFILAFFLPLIFAHTTLSWLTIYFGYAAFLFASLLSYFVNYRMTLLSADQRNYEVTGFHQIVTSGTAVIQMILALYFKSFTLYLSVEIIRGIVYSFILRWRVNKAYPWLQSDIKLGRKVFKKYPEISRYIKQIFFHRIGSFAQFQTMPMLIYAFSSLSSVTLYTNYTIVTDKIRNFLSGILNSTNAGIGRLIAEGNSKKILSTYNGILGINAFVAGFFSTCIYYLITPFVCVWLGTEYEMPNLIVFLISLQCYMALYRLATDQFIAGYGLFFDIWAPIVESAILIGSSILFGNLWGLEGVIMGPILSTGLVIYIWKPVLLFRYGMHMPIIRYWFLFFLNIVPAIVGYFVTRFISELICSRDWISQGWWHWIAGSCLFAGVNLVLTIAGYMIINPDMRELSNRMILRRIAKTEK